MSRVIRYLVTFIVILLVCQLGESRQGKKDELTPQKEKDSPFESLHQTDSTHLDRIVKWAKGFLKYNIQPMRYGFEKPDSRDTLVVEPAGLLTSDCRNLSGFWYNQHGSELLLHHNVTTGLLSGEYRTAVEVNTGFAGTKHSPVSGSFGGGHLLGFTVMWDGGESVASWTGQCAVCEESEQPKLVTTWTLVSAQPDCAAMWTATRVGQDVFTRLEQKSGPRKRLDMDVPPRQGTRLGGIF